MAVGGAIAAAGVKIMAAGVAGSAVLAADDVTIIGVADDPLLIVTGGVVVVVVGGVFVAVGGFIDWLTSW